MLKPVWAQKSPDSHCKNGDVSQTVVAHAFIPTLRGWGQTDLWVSSRPASWSTESIPGQSGLQGDALWVAEQNWTDTCLSSDYRESWTAWSVCRNTNWHRNNFLLWSWFWSKHLFCLRTCRVNSLRNITEFMAKASHLVFSKSGWG